MLQPKKSKFRRQQKGRMKGNAQRGHDLAFGSFGIKALDKAWITGRQIEAARQAVTRYMKREGQLWIRIFPDKPITKKPAEKHRFLLQIGVKSLVDVPRTNSNCTHSRPLTRQAGQ